ncbi:hypothetical protein Q9189_001895 [Teloschistes chrysophthalmus]
MVSRNIGRARGSGVYRQPREGSCPRRVQRNISTGIRAGYFYWKLAKNSNKIQDALQNDEESSLAREVIEVCEKNGLDSKNKGELGKAYQYLAYMAFNGSTPADDEWIEHRAANAYKIRIGKTLVRICDTWGSGALLLCYKHNIKLFYNLNYNLLGPICDVLKPAHDAQNIICLAERFWMPRILQGAVPNATYMTLKPLQRKKLDWYSAMQTIDSRIDDSESSGKEEATSASKHEEEETSNDKPTVMSSNTTTTTQGQGEAEEKPPLLIEIIFDNDVSPPSPLFLPLSSSPNTITHSIHSLPTQISFLAAYYRSIPPLDSALLRVQQGADGEREAAEEFKGNLEGVRTKMQALREEIRKLTRELVAERDEPGGWGRAMAAAGAISI